MKLRQLFEDDQAVSPVIGVILMVAITVILAAVIGTFVLGLGDNVNESGPTANFQFSYSDMGSGSGTMEVTHNGGNDVDVDTITLNIGGNTHDPSTAGADGISQNWPTTINTGDKLIYDESATGGSTYSSGTEVRIVWSSPSGGSSSTIGQSQVP